MYLLLRAKRPSASTARLFYKPWNPVENGDVCVHCRILKNAS
jgi:hypothetical protein